MKYYDAASNTWKGISSTNINLENEKGYMIFVRGDRKANTVNSPATPTVLRSIGKLYTPQFLPPTSVVTAGKFQSVGNPYASVIDFSKIKTTNIESAFRAWDPTLGGNYGLGGYQTITAATGYTAVPGGTANYNSTTDYRYIQSGQAFFVFNYTLTNGSVNFPESCKTTGNHHLVNREYENKRELLFANLIGQNGNVIDGNAVSFSGEFSNKVDGDDAFKIAAPAESFALERSGKTLAVEAREEIKMTDTIFYSLKNLTLQQYKLVFIPQEIRSGFEAYLVDRYLQTERQISFSDTSIINFTVTSEKSSYDPERFFVIFRAAAGPLAISTFAMNASERDGNVLIEWTVEDEKEVKNYEVEYSADGIHFSKIGIVSASYGHNKNYNFTHFQPATGNAFYRIKISKINGESAYQKVLKVIIPSNVSAIHIYPNPVHGKVINLQFIKQPLGEYRFSLYNSLGQIVLNKEIIYKGEANLLLNCRTNLSIGLYQLQIIKPNGENESLKIKSE
jgi:hypothetical protein